MQVPHQPRSQSPRRLQTRRPTSGPPPGSQGSESLLQALSQAPPASASTCLDALLMHPACSLSSCACVTVSPLLVILLRPRRRPECHVRPLPGVRNVLLGSLDMLAKVMGRMKSGEEKSKKKKKKCLRREDEGQEVKPLTSGFISTNHRAVKRGGLSYSSLHSLNVKNNNNNSPEEIK